MGVWVLLVGARPDLPLRRKWWHRLAQGLAVLSGLLVGLIASGRVRDVSAHLTADNTNSLTLLSFVLAHPGSTTLDNFTTIGGTIGHLDAGGAIVPIQSMTGNGIHCENPPQYAAAASFVENGETYKTIADHAGQDPAESRHCAATAAYQSLTADQIAVFEPTESAFRQQQVRRGTTAVIAVLLWLLLYWNVYYRTLVPIYARQREKRRALHGALSR